ncbi:MAG: hypothetical protein H7222_04630 [Methylotenera sp.]|nr:hypothetical protein [Oligoflexia bacterium]
MRAEKVRSSTTSARKTSSSKAVKAAQAQPKTDPLYVIFEQHLFHFQESDSDRKTFILAIVSDYLSYLRKKNITVPRSLEQPIVEELATQVNVMLVKKIYGCLSIADYQNNLPGSVKKRARTRYSKLAVG